MTRILVCLMVAALAACSELSGIDPLPDDEIVPQEGLTLALRTSARRIVPGDSLRLVARLTNHNPHPVRLDFSGGCQILPYVEGPDGTVVHPQGGGWVCTAALTSLELAAGETREQTFGWSGESHRYDPAAFTPVRVPLPPGEYRVHLRLNGSLGAARLSLRSNTETVTLGR